MRRFLRILSGVLLAIYLADLLLKKFFLGAFYAQYALSEVASYLFLFIAVGCFLASIFRIDNGPD